MMSDILSNVPLLLNVATLVFYVGFHFAHFKILSRDVTAIRTTVEATSEGTVNNTVEIARINGRLCAFPTGPVSPVLYSHVK